MKTIKLLPVLLLFVMTSCASVYVSQDYDTKADFTKYKTYAFYKNGIDKVQISDLDKRRILHAIEAQMNAKGFTKSETPDLLVNIFTKSVDQVNANQWSSGWGMGFGYGWGWGPGFWGGHTTVNRNTEGTLYIDLIDASSKELIWQGQGEGLIERETEKKEQRINEFVAKILAQYPPQRK